MGDFECVGGAVVSAASFERVISSGFQDFIIKSGYRDFIINVLCQYITEILITYHNKIKLNTSISNSSLCVIEIPRLQYKNG